MFPDLVSAAATEIRDEAAASPRADVISKVRFTAGCHAVTEEFFKSYNVTAGFANGEQNRADVLMKMASNYRLLVEPSDVARIKPYANP